MGFLGVIISVVAAWLLWDNGWLLPSLAVAIGIAQFWSWGVMHNHAVEAAETREERTGGREKYSGGFFDFTRQEVDSVPNGITWVNMFTFFAAVILLIIGFIV